MVGFAGCVLVHTPQVSEEDETTTGFVEVELTFADCVLVEVVLTFADCVVDQTPQFSEEDETTTGFVEDVVGITG